MRAALLLVLALLLAAPFVSRLPAQESPEPFPHDAHAGLFPNCTACHAGVAGGDLARTYTVTVAECAACHDGARLDTVLWDVPPRTASNLRFEHEVHMAVPDMSCATCHGGGETRMEVQPVTRDACLECHGVAQHLAPETDCSTCHVPLVRAVDLPAQRIAGFPQPEGHASSGFLLSHGKDAAERTRQCAVCHSRDLCETCHLNADRLASVRDLGYDDRVHSLLAGRRALGPRPRPTRTTSGWPGDTASPRSRPVRPAPTVMSSRVAMDATGSFRLPAGTHCPCPVKAGPPVSPSPRHSLPNTSRGSMSPIR